MKSVSQACRGRTVLLVVAVLYLQVERPTDQWTVASGDGGSVYSLVVEKIWTCDAAAAAAAHVK